MSATRNGNLKDKKKEGGIRNRVFSTETRDGVHEMRGKDSLEVPIFELGREQSGSGKWGNGVGDLELKASKRFCNRQKP